MALAAETTYADLPPQAVHASRTFLLDSLAVGVAGRQGPWRDALLTVAESWGSGEQARVLGSSARLPASAAAWLNAYQIHCLEFDCVHEAAVAHVMTPVLAALLAECEQAAPVDGQRFLLALTLGVEAAAVLGLAADAPLTFFRPATVGVFGAALAVAVLRRQSVAVLQLALGHALCQAAGTMQAHEEGTLTLPVQMANAARAGLVAADLADAGIPAPIDALEGRHGYFALFERRCDPAGLAEALGHTWRVVELSHKPWPSGRATHGGIDLVLRLRQDGVSADNLARLTLAAPPLIHQLVIRPPEADMASNRARLCFAWVGAVALAFGRVGLEHFEPSQWRGGPLLTLAQRFQASVNDVADPAAFGPQSVVAELRDGSTRSAELRYLPGAPERPLSAAACRRKVRECLQLVYADASRAEALVERVQALADTDNVACMLDPVTGDASQRAFRR